jgi:hypothetical protein
MTPRLVVDAEPVKNAWRGIVCVRPPDWQGRRADLGKPLYVCPHKHRLIRSAMACALASYVKS